jgi:hypothetical protein
MNRPDGISRRQIEGLEKRQFALEEAAKPIAIDDSCGQTINGGPWPA